MGMISGKVGAGNIAFLERQARRRSPKASLIRTARREFRIALTSIERSREVGLKNLLEATEAKGKARTPAQKANAVKKIRLIRNRLRMLTERKKRINSLVTNMKLDFS